MAGEVDRPVAWVTGATSFLGRHVARALARRGYDVAGFARASAVGPELVAQWGYRFIECGPFDVALLRRARERGGPPMAVFHTIGSGSVAQADFDPAADRDRTFRITQRLVEQLDGTVPRARLIYPSSAAVYGVSATGPIGEDVPAEPISVYGKNKLAAEQICHDYAAHDGRQSVIARFFSVYGPPQRKLLLWEIGQRLLAGEQSITLGGTGEETRDLIHVTDAAAMVVALVVAADPPSLINIGTGLVTSVRNLVEALARALGATAEIRFDGRSRPGNPPYQQADISRLAGLGLAASVPLDRGIADYAKWLRSVTPGRN